MQKYYKNGCSNVDAATMQEAGEFVMEDPIGML